MLNSVKYADRPAILNPGKDGYEPITYKEFWDRVRGYAAVLIGLGVQPGEKVVILSDNCIEWPFLDFAICSLGGVSAAIYPTLPADQAQYIAEDSDARYAFCGTPELAKKLEGAKNLTVKLLRGEGSIDEESQTATLDEQAWLKRVEGVDINSVYTLIYTSGTTGKPKGAMLTHRAFLHVVSEAKGYLSITDEDVFLSFLPLSHVFERIASLFGYYAGACIAMNRNLATLAGDFTKVQPTFMASVPRFLESFRDRVLDSVSKAPPIRQKLFALALSQGTKKAKGEFAPLFPITDKLVGAKIRERLGGKFRHFISGGAALPPHIAEFYLAMGISALQGYGLTETAGGTCVNHPTRNKYWTVGEPLAMELRIAEDGEILFRGPAIMEGYYKLPEETAAAIDPEGWFHTGDIGEMEGPSLKITDRKKDIIVLGNGKNIAPQPIENRIRQSLLIQEAVVLGDGMDHLVALIVPNFEAVRKELGLADSDHIETNKEARQLIKKEIDKINKLVAPFEMVKKFELLSQPFSIESGELTPTLKVKRRVIRERYGDLIEKF